MYKIVNGVYNKIGVHVGYDEREKCNVAVVITPELEDWIENKLSMLRLR